ncbi:AT-hook motif nuclear-localized protein 1-like [Arachis stenosperma]|uniref:AT-hook motif nuclear-localized protein 1-like n=1 Tax=Arachis stenosperma TaxID=217475 RepID=UPI0025AC586E|nr:AT-hook motif nuclear-localized protein 1-like [Arachis stenosperma]XP_057741189.1 AT-hook motif nuclear-localized protein 1-like [Arachis stenosperma]XP_057741191.1 AT-hook motif nuclear-localized protein 1-like [Arachis stenosperma]
MEAREGISSGVTVIGAEAPSAYHVAPRSEAPNQVHVPEGGTAAVAAAAAAAAGVSPVSVGIDGSMLKKKRGRPRKYGPDGSVTMALSPLPLSSSGPHSNDFSSGKRGKSKGTEYKQSKKLGFDQLGEYNACADGTNFLPHIITVNAGEDITMKVISFSQQGPRAICILSASGVISNVTLRQPDSSGGTLTYEGRFDILSLSGSFMPTDNQGTRSRTGGMSVSLASPDGRVVGGGVAGLLVAASPVQVVVGSFLPSNQQDQKPKKPKPTDYSTPTPTPVVTPAVISMSSAPSHPSNAEKDDHVMGGAHHVMQNSSSNLTPSPFRRENWVNMHSMQQDSRKSATDINISLPDS